MTSWASRQRGVGLSCRAHAATAAQLQLMQRRLEQVVSMILSGQMYAIAKEDQRQLYDFNSFLMIILEIRGAYVPYAR